MQFMRHDNMLCINGFNFFEYCICQTLPMLYSNIFCASLPCVMHQRYSITTMCMHTLHARNPIILMWINLSWRKLLDVWIETIYLQAIICLMTMSGIEEHYSTTRNESAGKSRVISLLLVRIDCNFEKKYFIVSLHLQFFSRQVENCFNYWLQL